MTTHEIRALPSKEKLQIMEVLWEDMRDCCETTPVPPELIALLRIRREKVVSGNAKLLEWDKVKFAIGRG